MHSGDTDVVCLVSDCELAWFLVCTLLVAQTVSSAVSVCELGQRLMCNLLVTEMWPDLFQFVSCPCF